MVRERGGNSVPAVFDSKSWAASFIRSRIANGTDLHADEAASWTNLHERYEIKRINHQEAYSLDGACADMAEEYVSRLRRAKIGIHHIVGAYHLRYTPESSSREEIAAPPMVIRQTNWSCHLIYSDGKRSEEQGRKR